MFAVVVIHTSGYVVFDIGKVSPDWFWVANIYESAAMVGVNLFVMLSGALILGGRQEPASVFFNKRIRKVLVPLMFWGTIFFIFNSHILGRPITVWDVFRQIITGPLDSHLWFLYMVLGLYLLTPALRVYVKGASDGNLAYFVLLWFAATAVYSTMDKFIGFHPGVELPVGRFIGTYLLGYLLARVEYTGRVRAACHAAFLAGLAVTAAGTYCLNAGCAGGFDKFFHGNQSPNIIVMSAACFLVLKNFDAGRYLDRFPVSYGYLRAVSGATLGVYIVHVNVLHAIKDGLGLDAFTWHPLVAVPAASLAGYAVSLMVVLPMRRIPALRHLVP